MVVHENTENIYPNLDIRDPGPGVVLGYSHYHPKNWSRSLLEPVHNAPPVNVITTNCLLVK